jgi:hypothetical protein
MNPLAIGVIGDIVNKIIGRVWPDPEKQAQAQLELAKMAQNGELEATRLQLSAILAEAQSADPWTSRARPSFLYVMYVMILAGIPMGVLYAFQPATALGIAAGMQAWLGAIPTELYTLFGVGYTGYSVMRGVEKFKGVK